MLRDISRPALIATTLTSVGVAAAMIIFRPAPPPSEPIIRPQSEIAAEEARAASAGTPIVTTYYTAQRANPWEVSDVAMEEILDEMIRRGWRPPSQGEAVASLDGTRPLPIQATDPNAPMPARYSSTPSKEVQEDDAALQATPAEVATSEAAPAGEGASAATTSPALINSAPH